MIRVGSIQYKDGKQQPHPTYPNYIPVVVMTASSKYWNLSPYNLRNSQGVIMENEWQFSKVYEEVPKISKQENRYSKRIIWQHPKETHYNPKTNKFTPEYLKWRQKGFKTQDPIRYPVGWTHRHKCLFATVETDPIVKLDYVESRKEIYLPIYCRLVKEQQQFKDLKKMLSEGKNLLILEVDGPHQESLPYYKSTYSVQDDFIDQGSIEVNLENMKIMLNDPKHAFGHGYCLGLALSDLDQKVVQ